MSRVPLALGLPLVPYGTVEELDNALRPPPPRKQPDAPFFPFSGGAATSPEEAHNMAKLWSKSMMAMGMRGGGCSDAAKENGCRGMLATLALGFALGIGVGGLAFRSSAVPGYSVPEPQCAARSPSRGDAHGLVSIGLSLTRNHRNHSSGSGSVPLVSTSNLASISRQTQFDLNELQDRDWQYACET